MRLHPKKIPTDSKRLFPIVLLLLGGLSGCGGGSDDGSWGLSFNSFSAGFSTLTAGQSQIVIEGGDITFSCPGTWTVKGASHDWLGGGGQAVWAAAARPRTEAARRLTRGSVSTSAAAKSSPKRKRRKLLARTKTSPTKW